MAHFTRRQRVTYTGTLCPLLIGRTGSVVGTDRSGWVCVDFEGWGTTRCSPHSLTATVRLKQRSA